ncbi:penicillin acylase family protein [Sphingosinicella terrae]|uniref:penicillin acylase family protein n=1 Tax=Sphingosinicella terrae TaxID=2172047 RepID=UPI000E0CCEC6|nr:penicillin acylase family protein [Sphingosinicella terrae]
MSQSATGSESARWQRHAALVTIARDEWGIAHVRGRSDADAVFGMIYAQAEDDFNRIETNYLTALGRLAEAEGEGAVWQDLRQRLFIDPADLRARYAASPEWLRQLMTAWADGLNFYLHSHPEVRPRVLTRFEPWMALSFSEGSIGGDIERISLPALEAFYARRAAPPGPEARLADREPTGSNGIAIAPALTEAGRPLLLINPHTSFFFRAELQMTSEEGLNAYGAATWGQFFVYQGFNDRAGWMHTSSGVDVVDEYLETIVRRDGRFFYRYGREERPVETSSVTIAYRTAEGGRAERRFDVHHTHHGPIVRQEGDRWVSVALMHRPVEALSQSFLRTKARTFADYARVMELKANSSNNTIYADADGNIAYLHPQFVPRRDDRFDFTRPVDGSDPATDWRGLHELGELPRLHNPSNGWIQNTNNAPWSAAGVHSPRAADFPRYMDMFGENPRGVHALRLLEGSGGWTLDRLQQAAYDRWLPAFETLIPRLAEAWDRADPSAERRRRLADPVRLLREWSRSWSTDSVETSLAVFWGEALLERASDGRWGPGMTSYEAMAALPPERLFDALDDAIGRLERDFGRWRIPWGEINRFQRLTGDIVQPFTDDGPSLPVGFPSARWGTLASFGARSWPGTRRWYGTSGNSFVAVVEFGDRPRARAVSVGGQSGDPRSPHFNDQAARYAAGDLRPVHFEPDDVAANARRTYRPGE